MHVASTILLLQLASTAPAGHRDASTTLSLIARARAARYQQDSALAAYDAIAKQRITAMIGVAPGLRGGLTAIGRMRLGARFESVARVGWDHDLGAWAEILAARSVVPFLGMREPQAESDDAALTLPYYPSHDRLWPMTELHDALKENLHREDAWIEHPLDEGADSLYRLVLGDSMAFTLPDGSTIQLREIRVKPRRPDQRLIVGSLWVDIASGALVRAAYRPSLPIDLWPFFEQQLGEDDRKDARRFGPYTGNIQEIVVEHALYDGRFWLPRSRLAVGEGTARGGRLTISIEQSFTYDRVAAMPQGMYAGASHQPDTTTLEWGSTWHGVGRRGSRCYANDDAVARWPADSLLRDSSTTIMYAEGVRFRVVLPCDTNELRTSRLLPSSIYSKDEELFTEVDFATLQRDANAALAISRQADWNPRRMEVKFGLDHGLARYNRVEGLSVGLMAERVLGQGYVARGNARLGVADLEPNAEATLERTNGRLIMAATAYRRLDAIVDWGNPFGLGASLTALVFGRDEGLFYRVGGVELRGSRLDAQSSSVLSWRLFCEREYSATVKTQFSVARAINGVRFGTNIDALDGVYVGAAAAATVNAGRDPNGTRASATVRMDGAHGPVSFGRGALELTTSAPLGRSRRATVTAAGGNSAGEVPAQRLWYLGGAQSVHGHAPGDLAGDAFWFGRFELTQGYTLIGTALFVDAGWAGPRADFLRAPYTIRGAGAGVYLLDGLVRLDASRGLEREGRWRGDVFIDLR